MGIDGGEYGANTVETIRKDLRGWKLGRALFFGNAGMGSEDNRALLARGAGRFVLASRMDSKEVSEEVLSRAGRYSEVAANLEFQDWARHFSDAACVTALLDRLTHHAEVMGIEGASYRLKEAAGRKAKRKGAKSR